MDNKILLELIKKDLSELQVMVDMLYQSDKFEKLVIELTSSKAQSLLSEITMLKSDSEAQFQKEQNRELEQEKVQIAEEKTAEKPIEKQIEKPIEQPTEEQKSEPEEDLFILDGEIELCNDQENAEESPAPINVEAEKVEVVEISEPGQPEPKQAEQIQIEEETVPFSVPEPEPIIEPEPEKIEVEKNAEPQHPILEQTEKNEKKILGEQFIKEPSLNERLASKTHLDTKVKPQPIANLKSAIGLNDRFLFVRVLFNNNSQLFEKSLLDLEACSNINDAIAYLGNNFEWEKNETSMKFIELLKRRFAN